MRLACSRKPAWAGVIMLVATTATSKKRQTDVVHPWSLLRFIFVHVLYFITLCPRSCSINQRDLSIRCLGRLTNTSTDAFNNLILPNLIPNHRECIHSPYIGESGSCSKTVDLQSIKQVLCQSGELLQKNGIKRGKTVTYVVLVGVIRNNHMSSRCLHFRTAIMTAGAKLLIAWKCWAVAEQRQIVRWWSL
jgi:hypothetical protein